MNLWPSMNNKAVASPSRALLFMQRCRQLNGANLRHSHIRPASQATPTPSHASIKPIKLSKSSAATHPRSRGVFSEGRSPTEVRVENRGPSIWTAVKTILGVKPKVTSDFVPASFNIMSNPFRARKKWPPNFKNLHPKHQFHYEKTYRRRMKLKYARPTWTKATKIVQWGLIYGVLFYWIFLLEMGDDGTPFDNVSRMHNPTGDALTF